MGCLLGMSCPWRSRWNRLRPLSSMARLGMHTAWWLPPMIWALVKAVPLRTSASRFGVETSLLPRVPIVLYRWSSARINRTLGRGLVMPALHVNPQTLRVVWGRHAYLCCVALRRDLYLILSGADIPRCHSVLILDIAEADGRANGVAVLA